jgi:hypothetical protein
VHFAECIAQIIKFLFRTDRVQRAVTFEMFLSGSPVVLPHL